AIHRRRFLSTNAKRRQRFGIQPLANSKPHLGSFSTHSLSCSASSRRAIVRSLIVQLLYKTLVCSPEASF
ncbi:unnamed protein product, partial [Musa hybrid cultivar]